MRSRLASICFGFVLLSGMATASFGTMPAKAQDSTYFRIATGSPAGTYFPVGTIIANGLSNPRGTEFCDDPKVCGVPGLLAVAVTTEGSVDNVSQIIAGSVESGFSQTDVAFAAYYGRGRFKERGPSPNLRVIARLYTEALHIVTRQEKGIVDLAKLRGRRVSLGLPNSGTAVDALLLLERGGIAVEDMQVAYLSTGKAADALKQDKLDAFFTVTGAPARAISTLTDDLYVALVPIDTSIIDKWVLDYPYYTKAVIPAETYAGVPEIETLGVNALWLASADVDDNLVYKITRAFWNENTRKLLDNGHPKGKMITLEGAVSDIPLPMHDGATRYYKEIGLIN